MFKALNSNTYQRNVGILHISDIQNILFTYLLKNQYTHTCACYGQINLSVADLWKLYAHKLVTED